MMIKNLCLVFIVTLTAGCASLRTDLEAPNVVLESLEVVSTEGLSQRFNLGLRMSNPNDRPLKINGISYNLAVNGHKLVSGVGKDIPEVAAFSEVVFDVQASTNMFEALRLMNKLLGSDASGTLDYSLQADIAVAGLPRRLSVEESGTIPFFSATP